jgi:hypothetical protein
VQHHFNPQLRQLFLTSEPAPARLRLLLTFLTSFTPAAALFVFFASFF